MHTKCFANFIALRVCWMRHWREIWRTGEELMIVAGNLVCLSFFATPANFQLDTNISLCEGGNILPTSHTSDRGSTSPIASPRLVTLFYTLTHKVSLRAVSINLYANRTRESCANILVRGVSSSINTWTKTTIYVLQRNASIILYIE